MLRGIEESRNINTKIVIAERNKYVLSQTSVGWDCLLIGDIGRKRITSRRHLILHRRVPLCYPMIDFAHCQGDDRLRLLRWFLRNATSKFRCLISDRELTILTSILLLVWHWLFPFDTRFLLSNLWNLMDEINACHGKSSPAAAGSKWNQMMDNLVKIWH